MTSLKTSLASFVIHYSQLVDRFRAQRDSPSWEILSPTVITEHHCLNDSRLFSYPGDLGPLIKAEIMAQCAEILHILSLHSESIRRRNLLIEPAYSRELSSGHDPKMAQEFYSQAIAAYSRKNHELTLQHLKAIKLFLMSGKDYCLILEDDSIPVNDSPAELEQQLEECLDHAYKLNEGYFDISNSFGFCACQGSSHTDTNIAFTQMAPGQTRCTSSYLLSREAAYLIVSQTDHIVLPVDWHISYILCRFSCPTFWYSQPIFAQGSQTGHFASNQALRGA